MMAVGVAGKADDLGENAGTPRDGVFALFEHERRSPLTDNQSVAVAIVGTRRGVRPVVARGGAEQCIEHRHFGDVEFLRAAGYHDVRLTPADGLARVTNRLAARGAGRGRGNNSSR